VPVDSTTFLLACDSFLLRATAAGIDTIASITPADSGATVQYQRLYGEFFLRTILFADGHLIKAERYRLDGTLLESSSIALRYPATDHAIALDRSDSSIFILCGSSHGVRMSHLRSDLSVARSDVRASVTEDEVHNPSGVVVGDSLHVAWEDSRIGNSDIFGFVLGKPFDGVSHVEPLPAVSESHARRGSISIGAITPNPADRVATFFVELTEPGDAVAEILDMTGQVLVRSEKSFDMDSGRWDIDISDLTNGLYVLAVRSGNGVAMTKLVVMRE
jgi:hypothetical protein